ncbi:hypothetical protein OEA41_000767 [Lepraria neglecta]|uniref:Uncharacterized protein n=1 Tax=Lepraria neglecta TaxID=209136 RepID=A0AAE0DQ37_9LECA|nr:hypothetical protein OEA41_000767 [Lepraria neglecta]
MSPSPQLSPAGSSSYSSNTMTVGDGTWDATRNTFLLPNLVGFNLATTQYNAFALLVIYFVLTHVRDRRGGNDYDSRYSYGTGSVVDDRRERRNSWRTGNVIKGALAGAGLFALFDRFRKRRSERRDDGPEVVGSRRHSGSYVEDEKYSQDGRYSDRGGKWENRLFKIAAPLGAVGVATWLLNRRHRDRDRDSDTGVYGPPLGGATSINDGRYDGQGGRPPPVGPIPLNQPLPTNQHPLNQPFPPPGLRPPERPPSSMTESSYRSASHQRRDGHGFRDGLATLGAFGLARSIWNRRRGRNDDRRLEEEQNTRVNGNHLTGDGRPPRRHPPGESTLTTESSSIGGHPDRADNIPPIPAGAYPGGAAPPVPGHGRNRTTVEELPLGGIPRQSMLAMPEIPPDRHGGLFHPDSSGSEVYIGSDGRNHWRHHAGRDAAAAGVVGAAAGLAAAEAGSGRRDRQEPRADRRASASGGEDSMASPPVSVKVKMHNDGRHVTLRRLPEAEAAAEREARRASRERSGRRRGDSASSLSGTDGTTERFRRNQASERQQAEAMRIESERLAAARQAAQAQSNPNLPPNVPAPPPIPGSSPGAPPGLASGVGSPGTYDGNTTEASADYANNRRRRRAERAQAKARENRRVEFE